MYQYLGGIEKVIPYHLYLIKLQLRSGSSLRSRCYTLSPLLIKLQR